MLHICVLFYEFKIILPIVQNIHEHLYIYYELLHDLTVHYFFHIFSFLDECHSHKYPEINFCSSYHCDEQRQSV